MHTFTQATMNNKMEGVSVKSVAAIFDKFKRDMAPKDDTLVEKLLTTLDGWLENIESCIYFMDATKLQEVMTHCSQSEAVNGNTLAFFYKITGLVAKHGFSALNKKVDLELLISQIDIEAHRDETSLRYAWIFMLQKICENEEGLQFICQHKHFYNQLLQFTMDKSVFVASSARDLIVHLIIELNNRKYAVSESGPYPEHKKDELDLLNTIHTFLSGILLSTSNAKLEESVTSILQKLAKSDVSRLDILLEECPGLVENLIGQKLIENNVNIRFNVQDMLQCLFNRRKDMFMKHFDECVKVCLSLEENGKQKQAIELSAWFLTLSHSKESPSEEATNIILKPLQSVQKNEHVSVQLILTSISAINKLRSSQGISLLLPVMDHCLDPKPQFSSISSPEKILQAGMQACIECASSQQTSTDDYLQILKLATTILNDYQMPYIITSHSFKCIMEIYNKCPVDALKDELEHLSQLCCMRMCDSRWEVRETTIQFVTRMIQILHGKEERSIFNFEKSLLRHIYQALCDRESYVRASAITALCNINPQNFGLDAEEVTQEDVLKKIIDIVTTDKEAFARRAGVQALCQFHDLNPDDCTKAMCKVSADEDWEVKVTVLRFWQNKIDNLSSSQSETTLNNGKRASEDRIFDDGHLEALLQCGCLQSLLIFLTDPDKKVKVKTCYILTKLKDSYSHSNKITKQDENDHETVADDKVVSVAQFKRLLEKIDLEEMKKIADASVDEYADNCQSLLDDILLSMNETEIEGEEDNATAVDCY